MKKLLLACALLTIGCSSQSITGPTASTTSLNRPTPGNSGDGLPDGSTGDAGSPAAPGAGRSNTFQYSLNGPGECVMVSPAAMVWNLTVSDSGSSAIRFVALVHHSPDPGCAGTIEEPRDRIQVSGGLNYPPHTSGLTTFRFDPALYSCGRVQVDVSALDAEGKEFLLVGMVVNYGKTCPPAPPPSTLECAPRSQKGVVGQMLSLTATGGAGSTFSWQAPAGTPDTGHGASFATSHKTPGTHSVTVTSGAQKAACVMEIEGAPPPPPPPPLACTPATQTVTTNQAAVLAAAGGTGSYNWTATTGNPTSGQGASFTASFPQAGTHTVAVSSGSSTSTCTVTVNPPPPPPACEVTNPPGFSVSFPVRSNNTLSATADVKNDGAWKLTMYAASSRRKYEANEPDYVKATDLRELRCLGAVTLTVTYPWVGHPSTYWWVVLERNGTHVYKSPFAENMSH